MIGMFVLAVILAMLIAGLAGRIWVLLRNLSYWLRRNDAGTVPLSDFSWPLIQLELDPDDEAVRKQGSKSRKSLEDGARTAQAAYHEHLARGVGAIASAFVVLAASVTWAPQIVSFSAAFDVVCFCIAIYAFWRAAHFNRIWMARRAKNELLRQWCVIDNLLAQPPKVALPAPVAAVAPQPVLAADGSVDKIATAQAALDAAIAAQAAELAYQEARLEDVKSRYAAIRAEIEGALGPEEPRFLFTVLALLVAPFIHFYRSLTGKHERHSDLSTRVLAYWGKRRTALAIALNGQFEANRVAMHFKKRPWEQANHFPRSERRLRSHGEWRAWTLFWAFLVTLGVCAFKLAVVEHWAFHDWLEKKPFLTFSVLVLIGLASAISALYVNQNNRSLAHRYEAQIRQIGVWLTGYRAVLAKADAASAAGTLLPADVSAEIATSVLTFEDLMIEELLDFLAISEHDVMELSPA